MAHAAINNRATLIALRLLLGAAEAVSRASKNANIAKDYDVGLLPIQHVLFIDILPKIYAGHTGRRCISNVCFRLRILLTCGIWHLQCAKQPQLAWMAGSVSGRRRLYRGTSSCHTRPIAQECWRGMDAER